ncbi:hypothetical protein ACNHUS_35285 [Actinomycetes bacterium M1A6_2h]
MSETAPVADDFDADPTLRYIGDDGRITDAGHDVGRELDELHPGIDWADVAADLGVHVVVAHHLHRAYLSSRERGGADTQSALF